MTDKEVSLLEENNYIMYVDCCLSCYNSCNKENNILYCEKLQMNISFYGKCDSYTEYK